MSETGLEQLLDELDDCLNDFHSAGYQAAQSELVRLVGITDRDPLSTLLRRSLPTVDFKTWWQEQVETRGSRMGGALTWPADRAERVALQLELCKAIIRGDIKFLDFAFNFFYKADYNSDDVTQAFGDQALQQLVRDIGRLAELRVLPPVLAEALAEFQIDSGDETLDDLLTTACEGFASKDPAVRRIALEKLWDAFERTKTLEDPSNKRTSVDRLLQKVSTNAAFREELDQEATALTRIGNTFEIRHFETGKTPIEDDAQVDYLFHRLWALLSLLLEARGELQGGE